MAPGENDPFQHAELVSDPLQHTGEGLTCPICALVVRKPVETACCGQLACQKCDETHRTAKSPAATCFHCRADAAQYKSNLSLRAKRQADVLNVRCALCKKTLKVAEFAAHVDNDFEKVGAAAACAELTRSCLNASRGCEFVGKLADLKKHLDDECTKGHREFDNDAIRICGGVARLKQNLDMVKMYLGRGGGSGANGAPVSPSKLQELCEVGFVHLSAKEYWQLCGTNETGGALAGVLANAVADAKKEICENLVSDYRSVLRHRVVDSWNLTDPNQREEPRAIEKRGVKRRRLEDRVAIKTTDAEWRAVFFQDLPEEKAPPPPTPKPQPVDNRPWCRGRNRGFAARPLR